jgi:nucleoid DNA-binding protein
MKSEYIAELLKDKKMIILPGLGAISYNPANVNAYTFNSFLKFNDGVLAAYVSSKENISTDEAGKKIETFIAGIVSALDSGQEIIINHVGKLKKSTTGKIEFIALTSADKPVMPATANPQLSAETKPLENKNQPEIKKEPEIKSEETKIKEKTTPETVKKEKPHKVKKDKTKTNKRLILWLVILIILLGGSSAAYIYKDNLMVLYNKYFTKKEKSAESNPKKEAPEKQSTEIIIEEPNDSLQTEQPQDTIQTTQVEPKTKEPAKPVETITPGNYYIVIGCFSTRENAEKMMAKSNVKGYATVDMGVISGMNYVAAGSASDMNAAKELLTKVKNDFPSAWIMKR